MDLDALMHFTQVAAHGGFGRASRATGRPKATLSRRVAEFETELGIRLIERGGKSLRLTEAGLALHAATERPLTEIAEAIEAAKSGGDGVRGRLRISCAVLFGHTHLGAIVGAFSLRYPEVRFEVIADDRLVDTVEDRFDIVIRANPPRNDRLKGRCIARTPRVAVAAPGLAKAGDGQTVRAVVRTPDAVDGSWHIRDGSGVKILHPFAALSLSSLPMIRDAVVAGAGLALLPKTMVENDLAAGRLVSWGEQEGVTTELWALHTGGKLMSRAVRAFLDELAQAFAGDRATT